MRKGNVLLIQGLLALVGVVFLALSGCAAKTVLPTPQSISSPVPSFPANTEVQTFTGFITAEDDFVDPQIGLDPSTDTRGMILMNLMARSGLGLAVREGGGWKFYYFSGTIATTIYPAFNGTGAQLDAWNIVLHTTKNDHIGVTVTGILKGDAATNPGPDADGIYYPVLSVLTLVEN